MLLAVLEVIAPQFKHFNKLRDFVKLKLPPGFPIQVNSERQYSFGFPLHWILEIRLSQTS